MDIFVQIILRSLETGSIYALATLAIILVFRTNLLVNFSHSALATFNTFVVTIFCTRKGLPLPVSILLGIGVAIIMGILIDFVIIQRASKVDPVGKQIITLGLMMVLIGIAPVIFGVDTLSLPKLIPQGAIQFAGATLSYNGLFNIVVGLVIMFVLFYLLQHSNWGLAIRGTASNEPVARMMGINTKRVTMIIWAFAAVLGVISGVMIAPVTSVNLMLMDKVQIMAFIACVLGGFQTFHGPVIAAYILGIASNIFLYYISSVWGEQIMLIMVLVLIVIKPYGLFGKKTVKKV